METNEKYIKFSGKVPLSEELKLGQDFSSTVVGTVVKEEYLDNQDGTKDVVYVVKLTQVG